MNWGHELKTAARRAVNPPKLKGRLAPRSVAFQGGLRRGNLVGQDMFRTGISIILLFCFATTPACAAGVKFVEVPAEAAGPKLTATVWYPCAAANQESKIDGGVAGFGPSNLGVLVGEKDCLIAGDNLPLIVVSHGRTGWSGGHKHTAVALVDAGFVVAAVNHPGDSAFDQSRVDDLSVLVERPTDIKRLIDFLLGAWPDAQKIDHERVGLFGFSMGGYTGLVSIGGKPDLRKGLSGCKGSSFRACQQLETNELPPLPLVHDPRIKAAVIVDPALGFLFQLDNLKEVKVPIQLWSSDPKLGADHVSGCCAAGINQRLPSKPDYHLVPNAGHFSFLAPCSSQDVQAFPRICTDAAGFDRAAFHEDFHAEVVRFFRQYLSRS